MPVPSLGLKAADKRDAGTGQAGPTHAHG